MHRNPSTQVLTQRLAGQGYSASPAHQRGLIALLAPVFLLVLHLQLLRSMTVDAYTLTQSRLDLAGYLVCEALGVLLILKAAAERRLSLPRLLGIGILVLYIAAVVVLTAPGESVVAILASRFGLLTWVVLGAGFSGMVDLLKRAVIDQSRDARTVRWLFVGALAITLVSSMVFAFGYLARPVPTLSYQPVANGGMVLLLTSMITVDALWPRRKPIMVLTALLAGGTVLTAAIMLTQSTSIVGFWIAAILVFLASAIGRIPLRRRIAIFVLIGGGALLFLQSDFFHDLIRRTRFGDLLESGGELSSVATRLELLSDFSRQFAVSPLFGHFRAEVEAGSGWGNYMHSLLLSFLTHAGIFGTLLMLTATYMGLRGRLSTRGTDRSEVQYGRYMIMVFLLGCAFTFMTWSVFWFMLGFLCRTPTHLAPPPRGSLKGAG